MINLPRVQSTNLAGSGYVCSPQLRERSRPAVTVRAQGTVHRLGGAMTEDSYVKIPRQMVLSMEEARYREERLKSYRVAEGDEVLFAQQYGEYFEQNIKPFISAYKRENEDGLEIRFVARGIVQQCGTRGAFERLFKMVRLSNDSQIATENNKENPEAVTVRITGDLFSAALFMGIISPDQTLWGTYLAPRIFHGIDIGWDLSPNNLLIAAVANHPAVLPMGYYVYTINVEAITHQVRVIDGREEQTTYSMSDALRNSQAEFLRVMARNFMGDIDQ